MKKFFSLVAVALLLVACNGGSTDYVINGGVTSSSGQNCHTYDYKVNPETLTMKGVAHGDSSMVTLNLKFAFKNDAEEVKPIDDIWNVHVSGDGEQKDVTFELKADEKSMEAIKNLKKGNTAEMTFSGMVLTADLKKLDGQKTWVSVMMP